MLEIKNLNVKYNSVKALESVTLTLREGRIYGIVGPSGSGKSSFLKGMLGLVNAGGEVLFRGKPIREFAKKTAYVEQKEELDRDFPITVFQCVLLGTYPGLGLFRRPGRREKEKVEEMLKLVHMWDYRGRQIGELSGGQFQRVLLARALVQDAVLLLLDEPFVGIDVNNEAILIQMLREKAAEGKTIFIIHHDLDKAMEYFDEIIMINRKLIAAGPSEEVLTHENLVKTYNVLLRPLMDDKQLITRNPVETTGKN